MSQEDDVASSSVEEDSTHDFSGAEQDDDEIQDSSEQTECLVDVAADSPEEEELSQILTEAHLDSAFTSRWKPAKLQIVVPDSHVTAYEEKRQDLAQKGRKTEELEDKYGFFVENNIAAVELLSTIGIQTKDSEYNALGYNRMGVYVCRFSDVCLQHALVKYSGTPVIRMVICKYFSGRYTTAIPRVASAAEFIEPTQSFDCHTSVIAPNPKDSLQNQFDRSQVYLYEINKLLQSGARPRHVMPYAVVHFTEDGTYTPLIDAEATSAEKLADNPRLQQIVKAINCKDEPGSSEPTPGVALGCPPVNRTTTPVAGAIPVITGGHVGGRVSLSPNPMPSPRQLGNSLPLAIPKGPMLMSMSMPSPGLLPGMEPGLMLGNPNLRRAITQLTAKFEAEERTKKAAGSDIIASQVKPPGVQLQPHLPSGLPGGLPGLGLRMPGVRPHGLPGTAPGLPAHMGALPSGIHVQNPAFSQTLNGALPLQNLHLPTPHVNNPALNLLAPGLAGMGAPGTAALLGQGHSHIATPGHATLGHNGFPGYQLPGCAALPPGFAFPASASIPKAAATSPSMPGAGILGSMPPTGLTRNSPIGSIPAARSLTPDLQTAGFLPTNGTNSLAPGMMGAGTSVVMSSSPYSLAALHQASQLAPVYSTASGFMPNFAFDQSLTMPKEATMKYECPPGSAALFSAKEPKLPGLYYQTVQPQMAAAYPQTVVLNQPLKRPLDVPHAVDKRLKYY